ncbi:MAG TPA: PIN domain-containing protein [Pyrinomonadaceae bacterium]
MLLDTSGLLCIHDAHDFRHAAASALFRAARQMLTSNYVLAEFVALAQARGFPRAGALDLVIDLQAVPRVEVVWVDETLHNQAVALLQARHDKTYSLCDAVSFLLMRERKLIEALTTDHHFEQEGFTRLLPS